MASTTYHDKMNGLHCIPKFINTDNIFDMGSETEPNDAQMTGGTEYLSNEEKRPNSIEQGESVEYELSGLRLLFVMVGMCLAVFLMALDTSIIATAIPRITSHFHSTDDIGWYGSAYALTLCALQPLAGKLYTVFSLKVSLSVLSFKPLLTTRRTSSSRSSPYWSLGLCSAAPR